MSEYDNTGMPMPQPKMPVSSAPSPAGSDTASSAPGSTQSGGAASAAGAAAGGAAGSARPADSWADVVRSLDQLGSAVSSWASAMRDDPENRRRVKQLQEQLEGVGRQIGEAADAAAKSDFVKQVGEAAATTGEAMFDTAKRVSGQVAPYISSTLQTAAEGIRDAARKVDEKAAAERRAAAAAGSGADASTQARTVPPVVEVTPSAPAESGGPEAPAPSPSVSPDE